jgi:hypothetical protein
MHRSRDLGHVVPRAITATSVEQLVTEPRPEPVPGPEWNGGEDKEPPA